MVRHYYRYQVQDCLNYSYPFRHLPCSSQKCYPAAFSRRARTASQRYPSQTRASHDQTIHCQTLQVLNCRPSKPCLRSLCLRTHFPVLPVLNWRLQKPCLRSLRLPTHFPMIPLLNWRLQKPCLRRPRLPIHSLMFPGPR